MNYVETFCAIQVELSTVCNSLCLGCVRTNANFSGSKDVIPKNKFLKKEMLYDVLNSDFGKKINRIEFCGNIDEPLAHPDFLDILEELFSINPKLTIQIHTNGGLRPISYHRKMAEILKKFDPRSCIRYGIDGLEDVHSIYRQNTEYSKALENMQAAISCGARVIWQYLIFPWNEHQVDSARRKAAEIGCSEFWLRPDRSLISTLGLQGVEAKRKKGLYEKGGESLFVIPRKEENDEIICRFLRGGEGTLFISWEGRVWPCCFHANIFYESKEKILAYKAHVLKLNGEDFNSLHKHTFDSILKHPFFADRLIRSWFSGDDSRNWRCVEKCRSTRVRDSDKRLDHEEDSGLTKEIL